jgi:tRNA(fMet)-specific endonuclease VapC
MYILDTDHISLIQRNGQAGKRILARLEAVAESEVSVTVITYEEQVKGRLGYLAKSKTLDDQIAAYQGLRQLAMDYRLITTILPFDRLSALEFERLRKAYPRLGQMDLKIAAIALTNGATLLTRNQSDFAQVVGLLVEDWAIEQ